MTFWIVALALAAICAALLVLALLRGRDGEVSAATYDLRVYRDQLREVEKDIARGVLSAEDGERARLEISRRILEADRAGVRAAGAERAEPRGALVVAAAFSAVVVVAGAAWLYDRLGAPGYPDLPLKTRIAMADEVRANRPGQAEVEEELGPPELRQDADPAYVQLVERLRAVVAERPSDAQGLMLLARNEAGLGNYPAAHAAQARLIALRGDAATAADHADLADMLILAAGGYVSPEAEAALTEALRLDPRNGPARYYAGLLYAQTGRPDLAFRFWQALLREGPQDAPWIAPIRMQIEDIAMRAGQNNFVLPPVPAAPAEPSGPTREQVEAAQDMTPAAQMEMIRGMVEGLSARLASEGGTASDWARLIRAYGVLGEAARVAPVVQEARQVFAGDPAALDQIEAAARDAGLGQ